MKLFFNIGVILFVFSFLFGCSSFGYQSPRYVKLAHKITAKTAKELKVQKNLCLVGTGGQMMDDIQMMAMSFYYYQEVDLKTARELIVYAINKYLSAINSSKEIRPYLHEYPFTAKNIEIRIFIYNPDRSELPPEKIYCVECINGRLEYYVRSNPRQAIYEETYQEALQEMAFNQEPTEEISQTKDRKCSEKAIISEGVAKDGAKVNIEAKSLEYSIFELNGGGFKPHEFLHVIFTSYHEILHSPITADRNGNIFMGLLPEVIGKSGGICYIDILRDEGSIHIQFPWGKKH